MMRFDSISTFHSKRSNDTLESTGAFHVVHLPEWAYALSRPKSHLRFTAEPSLQRKKAKLAAQHLFKVFCRYPPAAKRPEDADFGQVKIETEYEELKRRCIITLPECAPYLPYDASHFYAISVTLCLSADQSADDLHLFWDALYQILPFNAMVELLLSAFYLALSRMNYTLCRQIHGFVRDQKELTIRTRVHISLFGECIRHALTLLGLERDHPDRLLQIKSPSVSVIPTLRDYLFVFLAQGQGASAADRRLALTLWCGWGADHPDLFCAIDLSDVDFVTSIPLELLELPLDASVLQTPCPGCQCDGESCDNLPFYTPSRHPIDTVLRDGEGCTFDNPHLSSKCLGVFLSCFADTKVAKTGRKVFTPRMFLCALSAACRMLRVDLVHELMEAGALALFDEPDNARFLFHILAFDVCNFATQHPRMEPSILDPSAYVPMQLYQAYHRTRAIIWLFIHAVPSLDTLLETGCEQTCASRQPEAVAEYQRLSQGCAYALRHARSDPMEWNKQENRRFNLDLDASQLSLIRRLVCKSTGQAFTEADELSDERKKTQRPQFGMKMPRIALGSVSSASAAASAVSEDSPDYIPLTPRHGSDDEAMDQDGEEEKKVLESVSAQPAECESESDTTEDEEETELNESSDEATPRSRSHSNAPARKRRRGKGTLFSSNKQLKRRQKSRQAVSPARVVQRGRPKAMGVDYDSVSPSPSPSPAPAAKKAKTKAKAKSKSPPPPKSKSKSKPLSLTKTKTKSKSKSKSPVCAPLPPPSSKRESVIQEEETDEFKTQQADELTMIHNAGWDMPDDELLALLTESIAEGESEAAASAPSLPPVNIILPPTTLPSVAPRIPLAPLPVTARPSWASPFAAPPPAPILSPAPPPILSSAPPSPAPAPEPTPMEVEEVITEAEAEAEEEEDEMDRRQRELAACLDDY